MKKGSFGYISSMRKKTLIHTLILFAIAFGFFFVGKFRYQDYSTMFSITAIVVCIPSSMRAVSFIMFMIHKGIKKEHYDECMEIRKNVPLFFDSVITTAEKSYDVNVFALTHDNISGFCADTGKDIKKLEAHLRDMAVKNGFKGINVKIFTDFSKFTSRLAKLADDFPQKSDTDDSLYSLIGNLSL